MELDQHVQALPRELMDMVFYHTFSARPQQDTATRLEHDRVVVQYFLGLRHPRYLRSHLLHMLVPNEDRGRNEIHATRFLVKFVSIYRAYNLRMLLEGLITCETISFLEAAAEFRLKMLLVVCDPSRDVDDCNPGFQGPFDMERCTKLCTSDLPTFLFEACGEGRLSSKNAYKPGLGMDDVKRGEKIRNCYLTADDGRVQAVVVLDDGVPSTWLSEHGSAWIFTNKSSTLKSIDMSQGSLERVAKWNIDRTTRIEVTYGKKTIFERYLTNVDRICDSATRLEGLRERRAKSVALRAEIQAKREIEKSKTEQETKNRKTERAGEQEKRKAELVGDEKKMK